MIASFGDSTTRDIFDGKRTKAALRINPSLWIRIKDKLDWMARAKDLEDLKVPPSNHLEKLKGDLEGFHSIRVNEKYRIVFRCQDGKFLDVRCMDYH